MKKIEDLLIKMGAIMSGHFVLTSGLHSDQYIEKFRALEDPESLDIICKEMSKKHLKRLTLIPPLKKKAKK